MNFETCNSNNKKDVDCHNNCIRPKGSVVAQIKNVIVEVQTNENSGEEIYPPSKGSMMVTVSLSLRGVSRSAIER